MDINWIERKGQVPKKSDTKDVRISVNKGKNNSEYTNFSFRNGCAEKITTTKFIKLGIYNNRIYFKESAIDDGGYMLHKPKDTGKCLYLKTCNKDILNIASKYSGEYELMFDTSVGLPFIQFNNCEENFETIIKNRMNEIKNNTPTQNSLALVLDINARIEAYEDCLQIYEDCKGL